MSTAAWGFWTSVIGLAVVYVQNRRQHKENRKTNAELARRVEPVSNGFADHVLASLTRIEKWQDEHTRDHDGPPLRRRAA